MCSRFLSLPLTSNSDHLSLPLPFLPPPKTFLRRDLTFDVRLLPTFYSMNYELIRFTTTLSAQLHFLYKPLFLYLYLSYL